MTVTIPEHLAKRPLYGEYPIPVTTLILDGVPDFRVSDMEAWMRVVTKDLCGLCGESLDYWKWFIGGENAFKQQLFFDPAMHRDCAEYALQVCPFLGMTRGYSEREKPEGTFTVESVSDRRPLDHIGFGRTRRFQLIKNGSDHLIRTSFFAYIEWWKNGKRES
jgi:hypothetical protein